MPFQKTHGMDGTPIYRTWGAMKQRITNPRLKHYKSYGGRGLDMDPRWMQFEEFLADMGPRPVGGTLERTDNDRGYWPANCRWATPREQANNRRSTKFITINGQSKSCAEWARVAGLPRGVIWFRLQNKWPLESLLVPTDSTARHIEKGTGINAGKRRTK